MKFNGTFKAIVKDVGEVKVPAWIMGNFAIHHAIGVECSVNFENIDGDARNGTRKIETKYGYEVTSVLNVSHIHSGMLVYCPKFKTGLPKKGVWLKELKAFARAIELLADWGTKDLDLSAEAQEAVLTLRSILPQGAIKV
jgi:hypothetical protein